MRHADGMRLRWIVALALFATCVSHVSYTAADDAAAMTSIARTFVDGNGDSIAIVEDVQDEPADIPGDCQVANVVRGGGRGADHMESGGGGVGCGGCTFVNLAFVRATVTAGGLTGADVTGRIGLGTSYDDDPYAFPYDVNLECTDPAMPCEVTGTLDENGALDADVDVGTEPRVHVALAAQ